MGTPIRLTDKTNATLWEARYKAFGERNILVNALSNALGFPGQYFDQESGLHYNYFRYYDPSTGRYITSDPIGLDGGLNTYLYANANSIRFIDSQGLTCTGVPDSGFGYNFTACCQQHDDCYGCQGAKQNRSKRDCDQKFCNCMLRQCRSKGAGWRKENCLNRARQYCIGVKKLGRTWYDKGRSNCGSCP
ncbi:phospholipase A2 [Thiolapillus sp.]